VGGIDGIGAPLFDEGLFERSAETSYRPTAESLPPRADDYFSRENIDKRAEESRRRDRELREQPEKEFIYEPQPTKYFKSGTQYIYATIGDKTPYRNAWQLFVTVKRDKPIKRRGTGKTEYYDFVEIWIPKSKAYVVKRLDKPIYLGAGAFPIEYILGVDEYFWFDKIDEQRYNKYYNQFEYIYPGDALDNLDEDEGLGKPSAKFEFDDETARKDFLDELQKIQWDYNVKLTTGGTGGKPKAKTIDKSIFDDEGLSGKPWARFDFKNNDEMRRFTEKIEHIRWGDSGPRLDFKPAPAPPPAPSIFPTDEGARVSDVWLLPVSGVKTDTARFQNRKSEYSEASVERIVANFDENKLDPIVVWRDPENMRTYVLSGHSRLEAHKRLGKDKIKARFFEGTESEAIRFAKVDANRAATSESLVEDIEAFRLDRDGSANVAPLKKAELKAKWKDKANKLEAYSHLSPLGQFIKTLSQPDLSAWPGIVNKAMWAGELRAMYPHLTDAHEDELFNYMFKTGGSVEKMLKMTKEDLFAKVNDRANSIRFDPDEPLALTKVSTGYEARADTGPALARLKEIRKRIEQIDTLSKQTESKAARAEMANEKAVLQREAEFIDKDIDFLKSAQNALFGIGEIMNRWETLGYLSIGE